MTHGSDDGPPRKIRGGPFCACRWTRWVDTSTSLGWTRPPGGRDGGHDHPVGGGHDWSELRRCQGGRDPDRWSCPPSTTLATRRRPADSSGRRTVPAGARRWTRPPQTTAPVRETNTEGEARQMLTRITLGRRITRRGAGRDVGRAFATTAAGTQHARGHIPGRLERRQGAPCRLVGSRRPTAGRSAPRTVPRLIPGR